MVQASNSVTLTYNLGAKYRQLTGMVGLVDSLNGLRMKVLFLGDGRTLFSSELAPGSLPVPFTVDVAQVRELSVTVANISGAEPNWNHGQYAPGALALVNPQLVAS